MTLPRTASANYALVANQKERYVRKRCVNVFDSPFLTLLLLVLLAGAVTYFVFGYIHSKQLPAHLKASNTNAESSKINLANSHITPAVQKIKNKVLKTDPFERFNNVSSTYKWPTKPEAVKCEDTHYFINSLPLFIFKNDSLILNSPLFCSPADKNYHCSHANDLLILDNVKLEIFVEDKYLVLRRCQVHGISWQENLKSRERLILNETFSKSKINFRLKTSYELLKVECLMDETSKGEGDSSPSTEQFVWRQPLVRVMRKNKESNTLGNLLSKVLSSSFPKWPLNSRTKPFNFLILVLASLSKASANANLKQTLKLFAERDGVFLNGFSSLGASLDVNVISLLSDASSTSSDDKAYIWEVAGQQYATLLAEDQTEQTFFQRFFEGCKNSPNDHYMRPFWTSLHASDNSSMRCDRYTQGYTNVLEYVKSFHDQYEKVPKLSVAVLDTFERSDQLDNDLFSFFKSLQNTHDFSQTAVIVTGGQGERPKEENQVGNVLEDSPFAIFLPPRNLPRAALDKLQENSEKLTTPLDLYDSIVHLCNPSLNRKGLFERLPKDRDCQSAGAPLERCLFQNRLEA